MVTTSHRDSLPAEELPRHATDDFDPPHFPDSSHLVIVTPSRVCSLNANGPTEIFRSGSKGIVAAKRAGDESGKLAVADSQVVLLHDVKKGQHRSYRLKGAQVRYWPTHKMIRNQPKKLTRTSTG